MIEHNEMRSNNEIREILGKIYKHFKARKISRLRYVWISNDIIRDAVNWKPDGKRPLGSPKKRRIGELNQNSRTLGVDNPEETANNREE